jgi:hypothetical protein
MYLEDSQDAARRSGLQQIFLPERERKEDI